MAVFRRARAEKRERAPRRERDEGPYTRRFFAAVAFLVSLVAFGTLFVVTDDGDGQGGGGANAAAAEGVQPSSEEDSVPVITTTPRPVPKLANGEPAAGCPTSLAAASKDVPAVAPEDVTWGVFELRVLPFSKSAGPTVGRGDVARCYAHTPTGALIATAQISARYRAADDWRSVMQASVVPDAHAESALVVRADRAQMAAQAAEADEPPAATDPSRVLQIAGYKFVSYTDEVAVIQLVRRSIDGSQLMSALYTVRWSGGDWKLQVLPDATEASMVQREATVTGFVPWQPEDDG